MDPSNGYMWKREKRCKAFPWMEKFLEEISKSFPNIHESNALQLLHECVEKELQIIFTNEQNHPTDRAGNLFALISTFFINFCWKMKWKENEKYLRDLATKLLCYLIYLDISLYKNDENNCNVDRLLFLFKLLPDHSIVYDALLLINNLNNKERMHFALILRYFLCRDRLPSISNPDVYIKVLLLFRRLKQMIQKNRKEAVVFIASTVIQPPGTLSLLLSLNLEDINNLKDTNIVELLFNSHSSRKSLQKLRRAVLNEEHLAWIEKLQKIKTKQLSSFTSNIQKEKCKKISKDRNKNKCNEQKCKQTVKKKAKSSKKKNNDSDNIQKKIRRKSKKDKKFGKLTNHDKKSGNIGEASKHSVKKLKVFAANEIKENISDLESKMETDSDELDHCIVCEKNKEKQQVVLNEEHVASIEKLQKIKTNQLSSSTTNIQKKKCKNISKDRNKNECNEQTYKQSVKKKVKAKAKSSKNKNNDLDNIQKKIRRKSKKDKKFGKLTNDDEKSENIGEASKHSVKKLKVFSANDIKENISDLESKMETDSDELDHCIVCEQNKDKQQITDCGTENQKSDTDMNELEPSLTKNSCQLTQFPVIESKPSSVDKILSYGMNESELCSSEDTHKISLVASDNSKPFSTQDVGSLNSNNDVNESGLSSSRDSHQLKQSPVDNFRQCDDDSLNVESETELFCSQKSSCLTQSVTDNRRNESMTESFINMPAVILEVDDLSCSQKSSHLYQSVMDDRRNESLTESFINMPTVVSEFDDERIESGTEPFINVPTVISELDDGIIESVTEISRDMPILIPESLENHVKCSCFTDVGTVIDTDLKLSVEKSCQTDELTVDSNDYFITAGNYLSDKVNLSNVSCSANNTNALLFNQNDSYSSEALENILSQIKSDAGFQASLLEKSLLEIDDSIIFPSQGSCTVVNGRGGLHSDNAIHENGLPSETDKNSDSNVNIQSDSCRMGLDERSFSPTKNERIPTRIHNEINSGSRSSDTDGTEILPLPNLDKKIQSSHELYSNKRVINTKLHIHNTTADAHLHEALSLNENSHSLHDFIPAEERGNSNVSQDHFEYFKPVPSMPIESASHINHVLCSTNHAPAACPGSDKNSFSNKKEIPIGAKKLFCKPKTKIKGKNSTSVKDSNSSKKNLTGIDDIIAEINEYESKIHANESCLQNSKYHFLNQNKVSNTKNSYSSVEQEVEYNFSKENNVCNECTNIYPSVSNNSLPHNKLINVYNVFYIGSDKCKNTSVPSNSLIENTMKSGFDMDSSKRQNLSHSLVEDNINLGNPTSEENIFLRKSNAKIPNISDAMSSTLNVENNIPCFEKFICNQNMLSSTLNKSSQEIVSCRSNALSQDVNRKTKDSPKPNNVSLTTVPTKNHVIQQNSFASNCRENDIVKDANDSCQSIQNFIFSPEFQIKILNSCSRQGFVLHPASTIRVNLGERLEESEILSLQKDEIAFSNQCENSTYVDTSTLPRQSTNKFLDGIPITADHKTSYLNQAEINHGTDNESPVETQVNQETILDHPKIDEGTMSNAEIADETGENNIKCDSNSLCQISRPSTGTNGFATDSSTFHSPDSDSCSSLESTLRRNSRKSSQQNVTADKRRSSKASILKLSKFQIYSNDGESDSSSADFVCPRKRKGPENETGRNKRPVKKQRKRALYNANTNYYLRSRASLSAPKERETLVVDDSS